MFLALLAWVFDCTFAGGESGGQDTDNIVTHFDGKAERGSFGNAINGLKFNSTGYPITSSSFTSYTQDGFSEKDHQRVVDRINKLECKGIPWIMSNSYAPYIIQKYQEYPQQEIFSKRRINQPMKRICVITSTRADYGLLKACDHKSP